MSWSTIRSRCCAKLTCWRSRCQRRSTRQRRWLGLQMLEGDIYSRAYAGDAADKLDIALANLSDEIDDPALHIADARYQTIAAICDAVSNTLTAEPSRFTAAMDKVILNRFLGLPIFLFVMYLMFLLAINIGGALQPIFDAAQSRSLCMAFNGWVTPCTSRLADRVPRPGIGGGINTVLPLVPQIGMMYLFLSFLEDSGYMARAAFVMDRLMQALGLPEILRPADCRFWLQRAVGDGRPHP